MVLNIDKDKFNKRMDALKGKISAVEMKIEQLAAQSIPTDYPMMTLRTLKDFSGYAQEDLEKGFCERAAYALYVLEEMADKVLVEIEGYLSGEKKPFGTRRFKSGKIEFENYAVIGNYYDTKTGEKKRGYIFQTGYLHQHDKATKEISVSNDFGENVIQIEIGPVNTLLPTNEKPKESYVLKSGLCGDEESYLRQCGEYNVNLKAIDEIIDILETAEKYNVQVCVLLSPHYMPRFAYQKWPDIRNGHQGFLTYRINDERTMDLIRAHIRAVMEQIKDFPSLHSICISNEPWYNSSVDDFNIPLWHDYLKEKYGSINILNEKWNAEYATFENIEIPKEIESSIRFCEWNKFNNAIFADWHKLMAETVRECAPDMPVHAKFMNSFAAYELPMHRGHLQGGTNPEAISEFTQLSGHDVASYLGQKNIPLTNKLAWYDYLASLKKMPIFNSEDHILEDWNEDYSERQARHCAADMWQGAIHGRSMTAIWLWLRTHNTQSDVMGNIMDRPDVVEKVGKTFLTLNRLADEVVALQNVPPAVGILFSDIARIYSTTYVNVMHKAYEAAIFAGKRVRFITEKHAAQGKLSEFEFVIIPHARNIPQETFNALAEFTAVGGKLLILGEDSLLRDEADKTLDKKNRAKIFGSASVLPVSDDGKWFMTAPDLCEIQAEITNITEDTTVQILENGKAVDKVEWLAVPHKDGTLINLLNHDWENEKTISVEIGGEKITKMKELITGELLSDDIRLTPYEPKLLWIEGGN